MKKRVHYGTLLVDLQQHRVIDLLLERTSTVVSTWLKQHPSIEMVTRDRSTEYAAGITAGAPQALQVADRWHLLTQTVATRAQHSRPFSSLAATTP